MNSICSGDTEILISLNLDNWSQMKKFGLLGSGMRRRLRLLGSDFCEF